MLTVKKYFSIIIRNVQLLRFVSICLFWLRNRRKKLGIKQRFLSQHHLFISHKWKIEAIPLHIWSGVSVYCVWPRRPELYLRCSGSVTEWHQNVQDTTEIAEKLKLCVVDTSLKIFVVLQRDLVLFKISFPSKICNLNMTDVLYKKLDSTTSCKSKICSQKVCFTDGYQHILLCN